MKFTIPIPVYRTYVNIYISNNKNKLNRWNKTILSKFNEDEEEFNVRGRSYDIYIDENGYRCADIIFKRDNISPGAIGHEIMHSVFYIMRYLNIPLSFESEEAYTTLNEYLIESIHRKLKL